MKIRIFTDGACSGNPGPGGWGSLITYPDCNKALSGGKENTTNNEMELTAVVEVLNEVINKSIIDYEIDCIEVNSDSAYVVNAINQKWIWQWQRSDWITTTKGKPVKNCELWKRLLDLFSIFDWLEIKVIFEKVKGHSGNELNEMVDELARKECIKFKKGK